MLNIFNIEKQANKRVQRFLLHKSTEENIDSAKARLVINIIIGKVSVHLYEQHKYIKTLSLKSIVEFFGKDYDESKTIAVYDYLVQLSKDQQIGLSKLNVVICETKGELGAHLYDETKYKKRIPTLDLLTQFYITK
ncbi:MAG: hypothetical protein Q7W45_14495 [Bacteroidota bacterium]|nr:hypothetical protein [Bacteroidota bacterium]MDP3147423.1 hypothetical protein [Bacteroidota bacterium]